MPNFLADIREWIFLQRCQWQFQPLYKVKLLMCAIIITGSAYCCYLVITKALS